MANVLNDANITSSSWLPSTSLSFPVHKPTHEHTHTDERRNHFPVCSDEHNTCWIFFRAIIASFCLSSMDRIGDGDGVWRMCRSRYNMAMVMVDAVHITRKFANSYLDAFAIIWCWVRNKEQNVMKVETMDRQEKWETILEFFSAHGTWQRRRRHSKKKEEKIV